MKSTEIVQRLDDFVNLLSQKVYDRPAKKFIREFLAGIVIAQSTVLTEVVRAISKNNKAFKAVYKRINRRLGEVDFGPAKIQQQERAFREVQKDTIIAVDIGDISKPYANNLECLGFVADGSDGHKIKPGYWLIGSVAINPKTKDKTPEPLELKIYSSESMSFKSENTIIKEFISQSFEKTHGKGTYAIDRGGDRSKILQHFFELEAKFIIRLKERYLTDENGQKKIVGKKRQIHYDNLPYEATIQRESDIHDRERKLMHIRYDFEKVTVTSLEKKIKHECYLITSWSLGSKRPIEILTSRSISNFQDALEVIVGYLSRWSVEETYRFLKSGSGLEAMRCFTFDKLQNLTNACFITASLIARMCRYSSWQDLFSRVALRLKKAPADLYNWFYRAADACADLLKKHLSLLLALNDPIFHTRKKGPYQPSLFPLEFEL